MVARNANTSVGTSATAIALTQYPGWLLKNNGAVTVFLGDSAVSTANGWPLEAGAVISASDIGHESLTGKDAERLFGIVASGTCDVRVINLGRVNV